MMFLYVNRALYKLEVWLLS